MNEGYFHQNLFDKRKKIKPNFQVNDLVRVADIRRTFSKGDSTSWSYKLYEITDFNTDTITAFKIGNIPEHYNEVLLKKV